jgi:hypothetical protein
VARRFVLLVTVLMLFLGVTLTAGAQGGAAPAGQISGGNGSIAGTVTDSSGSVVPGATVAVKDSTGRVSTSTSDASGAYRVEGLPAGTYDVTVTEAGFKDFTTRGVVVGTGQAVGAYPGREHAED